MDSAKDRINALRSEGANEQSTLQKFASWARSNREENESDDSVFERFLESFMGSPAERGARKKAAGHYNEGGIADDGLNVDPVSGNEIPPGSLATEVRDDIPAQLSEGEYVVPADVVRYYGVRYFEDLRNEAKGGLNEMEANGRIGGEPVLAPNEDTDALTPEEMQELEAVMGMYAGGDVRQGYNLGGFTAPTSTFNAANYRPGYTFLENSAPAPATPAVEAKSVTLYGPAGEIATLMLPAEQARYDELVGQGYKTSQAAVTTPTTGVAPGQGSDDSSSNGGDTGSGTGDGGTDGDTNTGGAPKLNFDIEDPLAAVREVLDSKNLIGRVGGAIAGTLLGGPSAGKLLSAGGENFQNRLNMQSAAANLAVAEELGYDTTKEQALFDKAVGELGYFDEFTGLDKTLTKAQQEAREALYNPSITGGVDRTVFQSDEAFDRAMTQNTPEGMVYDPGLVSTVTDPTTGESNEVTGGYRAPAGQPIAPTTSIRPVARPDTSGSNDSNSGGGSSDSSNVGNYGGDRDGDGVPNIVDFDDGVGWADTNKPSSGGGGGGGSSSSSDGGGGGCCFIMLEARYGDGTMDEVVRRYRDEYMTDRNRRGYYKTAEVLVPLMRKSKAVKWIVTKAFADPLVSYGKYYYGENKVGIIFSPVKSFWMKVFDTVGGDTKFIRENGETV